MADPRYRREVSTALIASLVSILATLLTVLLSVSTGAAENRYAVPALYIAVLSTLVILGFVYLRSYVQDLQLLHRQLRNADLVQRVVPTLVSFSRREDSLVVDPNGDAHLTWEMELTSQPDEAISELSFPIFAETLPDKSGPPAVWLESLEIDEEQYETSQNYRLVERRYPVVTDQGRDLIMEYGLLRVPVEMGRGRDRCRVRVKMHFRKVFPNAFGMEYFYVDVPYITESLRVTISSSAANIRRPPGASFAVVAVSGLMETTDPGESNLQSRLCRHAGSALVWETHTPKLGYRYKIPFRLEGPKPLSEASKSSIPDGPLPDPPSEV